MEQERDRRDPSRAQKVWRFDEFELNEATGELFRSGKIVPSKSQTRELLAHLIRHRERMVSRDELCRTLWPEVTVSEGSLRQAVWELRQLLGDEAGKQRLIKTVRGRGYRFVADVCSAAVSEPAPPSPRRARDFFGRVHEFARLERALESARLEGGRACVLSGAPGIGKSRLARELVQLARARGLVCAEGRADPELAAPFWPWLQMLSGYLARVSADDYARYERSAPTAMRLIAGDAEPGVHGTSALESAEAQRGLSDEGAESFSHRRFRLLDELARLFVLLSADMPGLLLLDDLQWADEASLAFLSHFADQLPNTRALLVITCRDVPGRGQRKLSRALEALARGPLNLRLELATLSVDDVASMLAARRPGQVPTALASEVHALSHGNPLFALELAHVLSAGGGAHPARLLRDQVQVESVIRRRLTSLPEPNLRTALAASVLTADFSLAELAGVLEQSPEAALSSLEPCLQQGVLLELRSGQYRFAHPLVRELAYACLSRVERARLHRLAGDWIERQGPDRALVRANELANHFYLAAPLGAAEKAVAYASRCAQHAYLATAYAQAVQHYDRALYALDFLPAPSALQRLEIELARGEALRASGANTAEVNALFLSLSERAAALDEPRLFAQAVLGYTGQRASRLTPTRFVATVDRAEIALLERALAGLPSDAGELRVLLLCALIYALMFSTERARAEALVAQALELARALDVPWLTARVLTLRSGIFAAPQRHPQWAATCRELIAFTASRGLKEQELDARMVYAACLLSAVDPAGAEREVQRGRQLAEALGTQRARARAQLLDVIKAFWQADFERAQSLSQAAVEAASEDLGERALFVARIAMINLLRAGSTAELLAFQESTLAAYPDAVGVRCGLASAYAVLGNVEQAHRHFDHLAQDGFSALPEDFNWLSLMGQLADAAICLDDPERAALVYQRLLPYAHLFSVYAGGAFPTGPVAHWLGELATTMGQYELAQGWMTRARAVNEQLGAELFLQFGALGHARLLLRSRPHDPRIGPLLDGVFAFAEAKGLDWLRLCASRLAAFAAGDPRRRLVSVQ